MQNLNPPSISLSSDKYRTPGSPLHLSEEILMKTKVCFKCGIEKPLDLFYVHPKMRDGYLGKCKKCTKTDSDEYFKRKLEADPSFKKSEKRRAREKWRRLYLDVRQSSESKKKTMNEYKLKYPEKIIAHSAVTKKIKVEKGFHKHHWSYAYQHHLDVIILIERDHAKIHRYLAYDQMYMMYRDSNGNILDTKNNHIEYIKKILSIED